MTECPDCKAAAEQEHHGFRVCPGCCARSVARSPHFKRVRDTGMQDRQYRSLLEQMGTTHQAVKDAAAADVLMRRQK